MNNLDKLMGCGKKIMINGEEFDLKPLKMKDLPMLMKLNTQDKELQAKLMKEVIVKTLQQTIPEVTEDKIDELDVSVFSKLVEAIMDVNGFNELNQGKSPKTEVEGQSQ